MRTCVLLSGKSNDIYNHTLDKIVDYKYYCENIYKSIIEPFDADVFISTWDFDGIDNMIEYYDPKLIRVEDYRFFSKRKDIIPNIFDEIHNPKILKDHQYPMFFKIYDCNELKKEYELLNNFKYDLVIRTRFDLEFGWVPPSLVTKPTSKSTDNIIEIDKNEIKDAINNDVLYLSKELCRRIVFGWVSDVFAFSNSEIMDTYSSTYLYFHNIVNIMKPDRLISAENILYYNLENNNIETKHTNFTFGIRC